jgi:hypothetical protein
MSGRVRERGTSEPPRLLRPDRERVRVGLLSVAGFAVFAGIFVVIGGILIGLARLRNPYCDPNCGPGGPAIPVTSVTSSPRAPASPATGLAFAHSLLADVTLPPGAQAVTPPPALQEAPQSEWVATPMVDADRVWQVPLPAAEVITFFRDHQPRGTTGGGYLLSKFGGVTVTALYYPVAAVPQPLAREQVVVVVDPVGPRTSVVRVDAQAGL